MLKKEIWREMREAYWNRNKKVGIPSCLRRRRDTRNKTDYQWEVAAVAANFCSPSEMMKMLFIHSFKQIPTERKTSLLFTRWCFRFSCYWHRCLSYCFIKYCAIISWQKNTVTGST